MEQDLIGITEQLVNIKNAIKSRMELMGIDVDDDINLFPQILRLTEQVEQLAATVRSINATVEMLNAVVGRMLGD